MAWIMVGAAFWLGAIVLTLALASAAADPDEVARDWHDRELDNLARDRDRALASLGEAWSLDLIDDAEWGRRADALVAYYEERLTELERAVA